MKIIEKEFNVTTGEETIIEREETALEKSAREKSPADCAIEKADLDAKSIAKESAHAKLAALGLTADDLNALGL